MEIEMEPAVEVSPAPWSASQALPDVAGQLVRPLPTIGRATPNEEVMQFWSDHPGQEMAAVVDEGRPIGLLTRHAFMEAWAKPFQREVFGRKGCEAFMDRAPLLVEAGEPISALAARAVRSGAGVLRSGFIACRAGRYAGVGTGFAILEAASAAEAAKAEQLRANVEYAALIQRAQLEVSREALASAWPDHAILWSPRDVVGGDCFFFCARPEGLVGAVLDCTGHGVSGAFMTLIALAALERALEASGLPDPGTVLGQVNARVKRLLGQQVEAEVTGLRADHGFDGACFVIPAGGSEVRSAGAHLPLLVATETGVEVIEGTRTSAGYRATPDEQTWPTSVVSLPMPGALVLATDGVSDQVGGPRAIPFGRRRLARTVAAAGLQGAPATLAAIERALLDWQGDEPRRDDVTAVVLGAGGCP